MWRWLRPHRRSSTPTVPSHVRCSYLAAAACSVVRHASVVGRCRIAVGVYLLSDRARERGPKPPIEIIAERRGWCRSAARHPCVKPLRANAAEHLLHMPCSGDMFWCTGYRTRDHSCTGYRTRDHRCTGYRTCDPTCDQVVLGYRQPRRHCAASHAVRGRSWRGRGGAGALDGIAPEAGRGQSWGWGWGAPRASAGSFVGRPACHPHRA